VNERSTDQPEQPRSEPEIIPPGQPMPRRAAGRDPFGPRVAFDAQGFQRVRVFRLGPLTALIAVLALGGAALAAVVFLLGAVLVALPVVATVVAIAFLTALLRGMRRLHR
jgi:hypothetical protein